MAKRMMLGVANTSCLVCWSLFSGLTLTSEKPVVAAETEVATTMIAQGIPAAPVERPILSIGSEGKSVAELQAALKLLGYYTGAVDGIYAESTKLAVSLFQQTVGITVDGIVGPATWDNLFPGTPSVTSPIPITPNNPTTNLNSPAITPNNPGTATIPSTNSSGNSASSFPVPSALQTTSRSNSPTNSTNSATASQTAVNPQPTSIELPILKEGMRGAAISRLQDRLRALGFLQGEADGIFGAETAAAVKAAQSKFQLEADGIVGPATWRALMR